MSIIPISSQLYQLLDEVAHERRMVFITGLPGVGKSLLIQQLAMIAHEAGRSVHLLQWITARKAFETAVNLQAYPETNGVTHPAIRKAVGLWARSAVQQWHDQHPDPAALLIGELPLIGNRLIELVEQHDDDVESLLSSEQAQFLVPVPSWEVREVIESARARSLADPQNEMEKRDAAPNVLQALWEEVNGLARQIRLTKANPKTPYNPYIYGGVYEALLHNRHARSLLIDQVLRPQKSVYEIDVVTSELVADETAVSNTMARIGQQYSLEQLQNTVANWHTIVTDQPRPIERGPELRLPLPDTLPGVEMRTELTAVQQSALTLICTLPLDATAKITISVVDAAIATLIPDGATEPAFANVKKFDVYDSYFNVSRTDQNSGVAFLAGLLLAYRNVLEDLEQPPHTLTVVELPMLRVALETTVRQFL